MSLADLFIRLPSMATVPVTPPNPAHQQTKAYLEERILLGIVALSIVDLSVFKSHF